MNTPIAIILFNRPDLIQKIFNIISEIQPPKLFLIADGPRTNNENDKQKCLEARQVVENIPWDCEVHKNFSDVNLGCGVRPITGITWVFEHVDRAIILEDDCLPEKSFFKFSDELLEMYKDDSRFMQIAGTNYQLGNKRSDYSYFFSKHNICAGGWATWKRAWDLYDFNMNLWPILRDSNWLNYLLANKKGAEIYTDIFDFAFSHLHNKDFWDYQWTYSVWVNHGLTIMPTINLQSNLGFRDDGTHTKNLKSQWAELPTEPMEFPLKHPPSVTPNYEADNFIISQIINQRTPQKVTLNKRIIRHLKKFIPKKIRSSIKRFIANETG